MDAEDIVTGWLDPTTQFVDERQGPAGELVTSCIQLFVALVKGPRRDSLDQRSIDQLRLEAQRFSLWSDGFDAGEGKTIWSLFLQ